MSTQDSLDLKTQFVPITTVNYPGCAVTCSVCGKPWEPCRQVLGTVERTEQSSSCGYQAARRNPFVSPGAQYWTMEYNGLYNGLRNSLTIDMEGLEWDAT